MILFDLKRILKDIQTIIYNDSYVFSYDWYYRFIKRELNAKFGIIKLEKTHFNTKTYNALCQQIDCTKCRIIFSEKVDYIYILVEAIELFSSEHFNYKLYDYCEQHLKTKTNQRNFLYRCITNVHHKIDALKKRGGLVVDYSRGEHCILGEIFLWEQPEDMNTIYLNRTLVNLKHSCEAQLQYWLDERIKKDIVAYTNLLGKEIQSEYKKL